MTNTIQKPLLYARDNNADGSCAWYALAKGVILHTLSKDLLSNTTQDHPIIGENKKQFLKVAKEVVNEYKNPNTENQLLVGIENIETNSENSEWLEKLLADLGDANATVVMAQILHTWALYVLTSPARQQHFSQELNVRVRTKILELTSQLQDVIGDENDDNLTRAILVKILSNPDATYTNIHELKLSLDNNTTTGKPLTHNEMIIAKSLVDTIYIDKNEVTKTLHDLLYGGNNEQATTFDYLNKLKEHQLQCTSVEESNYLHKLTQLSLETFNGRRHWADQGAIKFIANTLGLDLHSLITTRSLIEAPESQHDDLIQSAIDVYLAMRTEYEHDAAKEHTKKALDTHYMLLDKNYSDKNCQTVLPVIDLSTHFCDDTNNKNPIKTEKNITVALTCMTNALDNNRGGSATGQHFITLFNAEDEQDYQKIYTGGKHQRSSLVPLFDADAVLNEAITLASQQLQSITTTATEPQKNTQKVSHFSLASFFNFIKNLLNSVFTWLIYPLTALNILPSMSSATKKAITSEKLSSCQTRNRQHQTEPTHTANESLNSNFKRQP